MTFHASYPSRRGGFAPRRGRGGSTRFIKQEQVKPDLVKHPLGDLLSTLYSSDLDSTTVDFGDTAFIKDCKYVASYNWADEKSPTIIVPGKPPVWTPPKQCSRLQEDSGEYFRDPNAAKYPTYPTEPAVQALLKTRPDFPTHQVDLFACGSTVGNLLRFARGIDKPFRFNVELVGNTIFFVRKENDPKEIIQGIHGFGHTFPEAYTTWERDVKGSNSHQRMVQYNLGGLKCVVRSESDGYLSEKMLTLGQTDTVQPKAAQQPTMNDILRAFDDAAIEKYTPHGDGELALRSGGSAVPQHSIFDLKTRSGRFNREIDMADVYPQLWLKQIPNFIIAYHDGAGTFKDIRVLDVKSGVQTWEKDNQRAIQRLVVLLRRLIEEAKQDAAGLLDVYSPGSGRLEIRRQFGGGSHALPPELRAKWEDVGTSDDGSDEDYESAEEGDASWKIEYGFSCESGLDDEDKDFTACSAESCGYCGRCSY